MAYAMEDPSKQFIEFVDRLEVPEVSNSYDITGYRAAHVIAIFKSIVNDRLWRDSYKKGKEFKFKIEGTPAIVFSVKPEPKTADQPGNGFVRRKNPEDRRKMIKWSYDTALVKELNLKYSNDTKRFAQDIKLVFKNNSELFKCENEVIQDVYILLLFEIGRRLVKDGEKPTDVKKALDDLPISGAITKIVKLFEENACGFDDVFLKQKKYHCFSGPDPQARKKAIEQLDLKEVQFEDIKELFYEEEEEESSEDTTGTDSESSEGPVSGISGGLKALSLS